MSEETEIPAGHETYSTRAALALLGFGLFTTVALFVPLPVDGRIWGAVGNLAHAPLFGLLVLIPSFILGRQFADTDTAKSIVLRTLIVALVVLVFGVGVELVQSVSGRTASVGDIICDGWGVIAAVLLYFAVVLWKYPNSAFSVLVLVSLAIAALVAASRDSVLLLHDAWSMHRNFPQLASFETEMELDRFIYRQCSGRQSELDVTDGRHSMEVTYAVDSYVTVTMIHLLRDWSELQTFEIDVALDEAYDDESLKFAIQVAGAGNVVYKGKWTLCPGQPQHIRITRQQMDEGTPDGVMDFSRIRYIDLAVIDPVEQVRLRLDSMRLTLRRP